MKRLITLILALVVISSLTVTNVSIAEDYSKYPEKNLSIIVPFGAGGATDLIARGISEGLQEYLKTNIAVTNMPGSASAVGNEFVYYSSEHDGYTILAQPTDITSIAIMGQSDLTYKNWDILYMAVAVPGCIAVSKDSEIQTFEEFVELMKTKKLSVATSDVGCAFTRCLGLVLDIEKDCQVPNLIPSGGGANAALSAVKGDVDGAACGVPECIEYIRSGDLRILAAFYADDLEIEKNDGQKVVLPSVKGFYPELAELLPFGGWVSIAVAADTPEPIKEKLAEACKYASQQQKFLDFLKTKEFSPLNLFGEEANKWAETTSYINAWMLYDLGFTQNNPKELLGWEHP
ncbi:MAG: Bug family tripartite tricarboxylate transporter substrate binding protein [Christensenellales bacterium]|jgi:tripartite-type tricarboxylate transporter receptor subunit TctC